MSYEYEYTDPGQVHVAVAGRLLAASALGQVVVLANEPIVLREAVERAWGRMVRMHTGERNAIEGDDVQRLVELSNIIARMQSLKFGDNFYGDQVVFATLQDFQKAQCYPRYIFACLPVGPELARRLSADVESGGMVVVFGRKKNSDTS